MVSLRVPASTANLGPGFDCLGCALSLHLRCRFEAAPSLQIIGCPPEHSGEDNLIYRAWREASDSLGMQATGLRLTVASDIPFSRGLGSSAAAITAGVAGAFLMAGRGLDKEAIFALAARIEGHPDNVAAAVFGGLRASISDEGRLYSAAFPLHGQLRFTALIPPFQLSTQEARAVLPASLPREYAIFNLSRMPLLLKALAEADLPLLRVALKDRLHQDARLPLIQDGAQAWQAAAQAGAAVFLSGAGPTLMCLHRVEGGVAERLRQVLPKGWALQALRPDLQGLVQE